MGEFWDLVEYLHAHPATGLFFAAVLAWIYFLLNRKSRLTKELDERLRQLREERGDHYGQVRPPK